MHAHGFLFVYQYHACNAACGAVLMPRIARLMEWVGLTHLRERYPNISVHANWADVLSLGEQQRLGMARLFHHRPKFAVLDQVCFVSAEHYFFHYISHARSCHTAIILTSQCTDAVSVDVEKRLYETAAHLGITIITVSQRPALVAYHAQVRCAHCMTIRGDACFASH
jgi:ABC-type uncharacterized transport system fused permease/ATPase subunit